MTVKSQYRCPIIATPFHPSKLEVNKREQNSMKTRGHWLQLVAEHSSENTMRQDKGLPPLGNTIVIAHGTCAPCPRVPKANIRTNQSHSDSNVTLE